MSYEKKVKGFVHDGTAGSSDGRALSACAPGFESASLENKRRRRVHGVFGRNEAAADWFPSCC